MARDGKMRIAAGLTGPGIGVASWRHPSTPSDASTNLQHYRQLARLAEGGKLDFVFIADSAYITKDSVPYFLSRFEPVTILSALASHTTNLGVVCTMTTSFSEPFTTARQLASLDKLSGGRAGWNAVTSALEGLGRNHGHDKLMDHALRYRIAGEYVEVVKGLWDSWEDDAFVRNKETGVYVDFDKMHTLNHKGEFFAVQGPLNMERSRQGRPVVFQAGASEAGKDLAARQADAIYSSFDNMDSLAAAQQFYAEMKQRAASNGRSPDELLIFPSIHVIIGRTQEEADARHDMLNSYMDIGLAVKYLSRYFSFFDFSQFPLDEPLPDLGDLGNDSFRSTAEYYKQIARENNWTLRQLALFAANPKGDFVGTPEKIANNLERLFVEKGADGFVINSPLLPDELQSFVELVVPILQQRGLFRTEYETDTLRGNLGIPYPVNRYAKI